MNDDEQEIRDTAHRAADVNRERGRVCAVGAIRVACGCEPRSYTTPAGAGVAGRALALVAWDHDLLSEWNDDPCRTAEEVIALLERVASGEGAP